MKVITMESSAYKEMMAQIANIAGYIREARDEKKRKRETEDKLLDTAQAAKMLNVSKRTMQRMRTDHRIEYVVVRGSCRYRLSEILRLLEDNTVSGRASCPCANILDLHVQVVAHCYLVVASRRYNTDCVLACSCYFSISANC